MFKKNDIGSSGNIDTLVGPSTVFTGNIESEGSIRVDGKVNGDLKVGGDVFIGAGAVIKGSIYANNVHISGMVEGNIFSKGILHLLSTAKQYGDIQVHSFVTDEGAVFQGKCSMVESPEPSEVIDEKPVIKKPKDYKKSSALDQIDEKDKASESK